MGKEIEKKYLVDHAKWQKTAKPKGELYRQGYLVADSNKTIRVRLTEKSGWFLKFCEKHTIPIYSPHDLRKIINLFAAFLHPSVFLNILTLGGF